jgi:hypothetical protein
MVTHEVHMISLYEVAYENIWLNISLIFKREMEHMKNNNCIMFLKTEFLKFIFTKPSMYVKSPSASSIQRITCSAFNKRLMFKVTWAQLEIHFPPQIQYGLENKL